MPPILLLAGNASAAERERCAAFADLLRRRASHGGGATAAPAPADPNALHEALLALGRRGRLSYAAAEDGAVEVFYVPSREALLSVQEAAPDAAFPEAVQKKQTAAFRSSQGAILRFLAEQGDGALEVYITDWSPCPAACAVAIHRSHPFAADLDKGEGAWFTGRYVRHPLTGDLLPVWIADWVRPDFGTGAVLVNPAHDATDLAFGRSVGLPVRFALVPESYDGSPATWPAPPVVKTGRTIRTGPYDGLTVDEAVPRYFDAMAERGLAARHRDVQAGRWKIGRLVTVPDTAGQPGGLEWSAARWAALPPGSGGSPVQLEDSGLLAAALAAEDGATVVCPAGEQAGELLALRLLARDLTEKPLAPAAVYLVQKVQESKTEAAPEVVRLAALLSAPLAQVAVIKQQTVEQVQRFLRVHQELAEQGGAGAPQADAPAARSYGKIKAAIAEADPAKAFTLLAQAQKQLRDLPAEGRSGALAGYFVLAQVVAGLDVPAGLDAGQAWEAIQ